MRFLQSELNNARIYASKNSKLAKVHKMHKLARNLTTNLQARNCSKSYSQCQLQIFNTMQQAEQLSVKSQLNVVTQCQHVNCYLSDSADGDFFFTLRGLGVVILPALRCSCSADRLRRLLRITVSASEGETAIPDGVAMSTVFSRQSS